MAKRKKSKLHTGYIIIISVALIVGIVAGYFVGNVMYGKDTFALNGEKISYVKAGTTVTYEDEGIKYISKGKNLSDSIEIETNMALVDGKYVGIPDGENELYIIYKATSGRAKGETLYRVFRVTESGEAA